MKNLFFRNIRVMKIVAAALVLCMGLIDMSAYMRYLSGGSFEDIAVSSNDESLITEEHAMETELADGHYDGRGSDSENGISRSIKLVEGKRLFNILEILPTERRGVVGYTIGGCEPFDVEDVKYGNRTTTKAELKQAYMDALVNPKPGTDQAGYLPNSGYYDEIKELNQKLKENATYYGFDFETGNTYNGYYKYVGNNKGVYCKVGEKFESRFYTTGKNDYNYIFVYGDGGSYPGYDSTLNDIKVTGEKRVRYINNEKLIKEWLGWKQEDLSKMKFDSDEDKQKFLNRDPSTVKKYIEFEVTTKTPVTVSAKDIERADLILINNANKPNDTKDYYFFATRLKNRVLGETDLLKDWYLHFYSPEDDGEKDVKDRIDFVNPVEDENGKIIDDRGFDKVIRIYERAVVREDCGIVVEKCCLTCHNGSNEITSINTNLRKLMFMLFYVKSDGVIMAGRDLFSDFFKRYTDEPGYEYLKKRMMHLADPDNYPVDYRAAWLKRNGNDPTDASYYYMHKHSVNHVGHPLVLDKNECITGVQTRSVGVDLENEDGETRTVFVTLPVLDDKGKIKPERNETKAENMKLGIQTYADWMLEDGKLTFLERPNESSYDNYEDYKKALKEYEANKINPGTGTPGKYYKDGDLYYYNYCYESMSNTTDYIYIDDNGKLIIDTKYSSDETYNSPDYWKYWYKIDWDNELYVVDGNSFRRRKWGAGKCEWVGDADDPWPWDSGTDDAYMNEWLMAKKPGSDLYDCNMHMWYDYGENAKSYGGNVYTTLKNAPFGKTYHNQSLMGENGFLHGNWLKDAMGGRKIKRETGDINHTTSVIKNYYYSMNIVNGDGVNVKNGDADKKNKTLYYNQYEKDKILTKETGTDNAYIPINIEVKSSCEIKSIKVSGGVHEIVYSIDDGSVDQDEIDGANAELNALVLKRKTKQVGENTEPVKGLLGDGTPYYTFNGSINGVLYDWYKNGRNTKIEVEMTVLLPDNTTEATVKDEITIVKRDFFMLD